MQIESRQVATPPSKPRSRPTLQLLQNPDARNLAELAGRIGIPLAALLLALLAIPLSFVNPRAGRTNNLLLALFTYLIYSNVISVSQAWVAQGRLRFDVALLLPHLLVVVLIVAMFYLRLTIKPFWRARA